MSETILLLGHGFANAATVYNLLAASAGVLLGTLAGVLPGLGIAGTVAILLPFSYGMEPLTALILISGIYFGTQYGGSTTSILVNIPGEATSVVTSIDGYAMAKQGRAGAALGIAAIGSFVAGTMGLLGLTFLAPVLSSAALAFGPPEYCALALLGLVVLANVFGTSPVNSTLMIFVGIMIGTVGRDPMSGVSRFTLGIPNLESGIDFVVLLIGVYGISEVLFAINESAPSQAVQTFRFRELYPTRDDLKRSTAPIFRGGLIGFLLGLIPGPSTVIATFVSYATEKKVSRHPEEFGKGAIEGVAGPEAANNASMYAQMIPLMSLGIPFSAPMALMVSGFMIHGISPGPMLVSTHPDLFWGLMASMYIGNILLLIINLPLVGLYTSILNLPLNVLLPVITLITFAGAYSINNSIFDLGLMLTFGVLAYFARAAGLDITAFILGAFLGRAIEEGLIQGLAMTSGSITALIERPIVGSILLLTAAIILINVTGRILSRRKALQIA